MSGPAVTIVEEGGAPVTPVDSDAPLVEAVASGGVPITLTANATPMIVRGNVPPDPPLGPLDFASIDLGAFDNFSHEYELASESAVIGLAAYYTGTPVIEIAHGGEPFTIIQDERRGGLMTIIAAATGLTLETADLTITVTGGSVGGGALRINEMVNVAPELYGWHAGGNNEAPSLYLGAVTGSQGGKTKIAFASAVNDPYLTSKLIGADDVWRGFLTTGPLVPMDMTETGDWTLGAGWSWVDGDLVHTGPESTASIPVPAGTTSGVTRGRCRASIDSAAKLKLTAYTDVVRSGPYDGYMATGVSGVMASYSLTATGDVTVSEMSVVTTGHTVTWIFGTAQTENGAIYGAEVPARAPRNVISAAEILGEDY